MSNSDETSKLIAAFNGHPPTIIGGDVFYDLPAEERSKYFHRADGTYQKIDAESFDIDLSGLATADHEHDGVYAAIEHEHSADDITSGEFDDARISATSVLQHENSLTISSDQIVGLQHSELADLGTDDHLQYFNQERGDLRYYTRSEGSLMTDGFLPLSGGSITNNLDVGGQFVVDSDATTPLIGLKRSGVWSTQLLGYATSTLIRNLDSSGDATNYLTIHNDFAEFDSVVRGSTPVNSVDFTTKGYVDDGFVNTTTNQTVAGAKTFTSSCKTYSTSPYFTLESSGTSNGYLQFRHENKRSSLFYTSPNASQWMHYADDGTTQVGGLRIYQGGYIQSTMEHRGVDGTNSASFTTKGYVDNGFVDTTSNQTVAGAKTFTSTATIQTNNASLTIDGDNGTTPRLYLKSDYTTTFDIQGLSNRTLIRRYTPSGDNRLEMYDDSSRFDHDVRCSQMGSNSLSLTTKAYVDAVVGSGGTGGGITDHGLLTGLQDDDHTQYHNNERGDLRYVKLTGAQTIEGIKTFTSNVVIDSSLPLIQFELNGTRSLRFHADDTLAGMYRYNSSGTLTSQLKLYDTYSTLNVPLRYSNVSFTDDNDLVTKGYVDAVVGSGGTGGLFDGGTVSNDITIDTNDVSSKLILNNSTDATGIIRHTQNFVDIVYQDDGNDVYTKIALGDSDVGFNTPISITTDDNPTISFNNELNNFGALFHTGTKFTWFHEHTGAGVGTTFNLFDDYASIDKPLRGVTPQADLDLTTKRYVDNSILTAEIAAGSSGGGNHTALTNLDADDHPQYVLTNGGRKMTGDLVLQTTTPEVLFRRSDGSNMAALHHDETNLILKNILHGNYMTLAEDNTISTKPIEAPAGSTSASLVRKDELGPFNGLSYWTGTQSDYDAISPKDPSTIYFVED